MSIDGEWIGFYLEPTGVRKSPREAPPDCIFPIEANLKVVDGHISGTMTDLRPECERTTVRYVQIMSNRMDFKTLNSWEKHIREHPDGMIRTNVWPESSIEGTIDGDEIIFKKSYLGPCETLIWSSYYEQKNVLKRAYVMYYGRLSADRNLMEGHYKFFSGYDGQVPTYANNYFELKRAELIGTSD